MQTSPYNCTVIGKILLTPDLMILRVRTDEPRTQFKAGQFTTIGLMSNESRSANSVMPVEDAKVNTLITRPYSIASANYDTSEFEFYISQVKSGQLTPRLFDLSQGRRMWIDDKILGVFDLNSVAEGSNIVMIATGTGLAPYMSFLRSHIKDHQDVKLAVIHGAAYQWDLGYYSELQFIQAAFPNFYYFPTLLKPDSSWTGLTGYIEKHLESEVLQKAGFEIEPCRTQFFLCGNPKMVESVTTYLNKHNYMKNCENGGLHVEEY